MRIIQVLVVSLLSFSVFAQDVNVFESVTVGFKVTKPSEWQFVTAEENLERLKNIQLNDEEFNHIKKISNNIDNDVLILFWQFTIQTLSELDVVSNQHLSIEMFFALISKLSA